MANVLLTEKCVRSCPYCFAKEYMTNSSVEEILKWEDLIYIADLFESSNEKHISLLGGEPSLHPNFTEFILYLLKRNFHVNVFTSGIMSEKILLKAKENLRTIDPEQLSFVCNINNPKDSLKNEFQKVKKFLKVFNKQTSTSFNIYKSDFDLNFLIDIIKEYQLKPHIRLGLAHPIPGANNFFLKINEFKVFAKRLMSFFNNLENNEISIGLDCGFVMCIFSDTQLGKLFKLTNNRLGFSCGPAIDFGPDMSVWSCFPLSNIHKKSIYDFNSLKEIYDFYFNMNKEIRGDKIGILKKCSSCSFNKRNLCAGGCTAHLVDIKNFIV